MAKRKPPTIDQRITDALWARGELSWLLLDHQHIVYDALKEAMLTGELKYYLNCARRFGKTTVLLLLALEQCVSEPNQQVRFASPNNKELKKIILPIINMLMESMPNAMQPTYNSIDTAFKFPNKSMLHLSGVNNGNADSLRGSAADLILVDECSSVDNLKYLVQSVLLPQTIHSNALTILASTPALSQDHDSYVYYCEARDNDMLAEFTIYDNTSISPEKIAQICKDNGGSESTTFLREYMGEWVTDFELMIVPEFIEAEMVKPVVRDDMFNFWHKYVSMDLGTVDNTSIIYGYYNFAKATLYIEAEDVMHGHNVTTKLIHEKVSYREKQLWEGFEIHKRVSDNNSLITLHDLSKEYDMYFFPTLKDSLEAMVNEMRLFVGQGRLVISPACKDLIGCLKYGLWTQSKGKREFARSSKYGHVDTLAALMYLIRNLEMSINPVPAGLGITDNKYHIKQGHFENQDIAKQAAIFRKIFNK